MGNIKFFKKVVEDFVCENCGEEIKGDGFTNHCPKCFYSKHVDIFPGDRLESCLGLMEPVEILKGKRDEFIIIHKCKKCGDLSKDKFREGIDDFDNFLILMNDINSKKDIRL